MSLVGWTKRGPSGKTISSLTRIDNDTVTVTYTDGSTENVDFSPACAVSTDANFRKDIGAGLAQQSVIDLRLPQAAGFAIVQVPATLLTTPEAGFAVETFASGTAKSSQEAGINHTNIVTIELLEAYGVQVQQTYDYTGTKWIATATNIGSDNWTSVTNAQGANDSSNASRSGQALSTTDAQIRGQMDAVGTKDSLTIDKVELWYYVQQTGTTLNNGGLELDWRIGTTGAWTNLATYTNNQNFLTTPDTHAITGSITDWDDIRAIEVRVRANLGAGTTLVTCNCDAVRLHIEASLVD